MLDPTDLWLSSASPVDFKQRPHFKLRNRITAYQNRDTSESQHFQTQLYLSCQLQVEAYNRRVALQDQKKIQHNATLWKTDGEIARLWLLKLCQLTEHDRCHWPWLRLSIKRDGENIAQQLAPCQSSHNLRRKQISHRVGSSYLRDDKIW